MLLPEGTRPALEATLTMRPSPRSRIIGTTARALRKAPFTFTAMMRSQSASLTLSRSGKGTCTVVPAEYTKMLAGPSCSPTSRTMRSTWPLLVTSASTAMACAPSAEASSRVS